MMAIPFPYSWVQQYQVVADVTTTPPQIGYRQQSPLAAVLEALRVLPEASLQLLTDEAFEQRVLQVYQQGAPSRELADQLGGDFDLHHLVDTLPQDNDLLDSDDGAPVIRLINAILSEAIKEGASDVHIEPFEKQLNIRFRIDGMLRPVLSPPPQLSRFLLSRIKVMAKLDIAEKRIPQDGRISLRIGGRSVDVRVSTLPSSYGERIVLRVLDKQSVKLTLVDIGMTEAIRESLGQLLNSAHGILLVTGPTGSGKSTTLYAALRQVWSEEKNIMTIEDPVEYELDGIGQTQVNSKVDMTFSRGLRAILRQDPDVVMIGEIRDTETAQIAVQASLTGHLVLSTLHTNSAPGAIERLQDMGVEPFLLASSLQGVLAQRLVRKLCPHCRQQRAINPAEYPLLRSVMQATDSGLYAATGCEQCHQTGYRGRTGIHELLLLNDALRQALSSGARTLPLPPYATLQQDGLRKALDGITTLEEVLRVSQEGG